MNKGLGPRDSGKGGSSREQKEGDPFETASLVEKETLVTTGGGNE